MNGFSFFLISYSVTDSKKKINFYLDIYVDKKDDNNYKSKAQ